MAAVKTKVGESACFVCGREVVWRKTEGGAVSCFCQHCDFQGYAKNGTEADRTILKNVGHKAPPPANDPAPDPAPKPEPTPGMFGGPFGL